MRLETLGPNQTLVHIGGQEYFFSYSTCVAGRDEDKFWKVDHKYSNTTSRHVNNYLNGMSPVLVKESDVQLAMDCL